MNIYSDPVSEARRTFYRRRQPRILFSPESADVFRLPAPHECAKNRVPTGDPLKPFRIGRGPAFPLGFDARRQFYDGGFKVGSRSAIDPVLCLHAILFSYITGTLNNNFVPN